MTKFIMRTAPTKPVRINKEIYGSIDNDDTVIQMVFKIAQRLRTEEKGWNLKGYEYITEEWLLKNLDKVKVMAEHYGDYDEGYYFNTVLKVPESDHDFNLKLKTFDKKQKEYNDWQKKHSAEIEMYLKEKKEKLEKEKKRKELEEAKWKIAEKARLQKVLENTQKKLSKLKAESN